MADNPMRRDRVTREDVAAQFFDRRHLGFGKQTVTPFMAGIDDLDADRNVVEIALTRPA
jgi:hypothetical protein